MSQQTISKSNSAEPKFFAVRRLGHVNLYSADFDGAMKFYTEVIGVEEVYRTPLVGGGFMSNGNTHHDIAFIDVNGPVARARKAKSPQLNHLGFELESEVALVECYNKAIAAGQTFLRTMDHDIAHSVYNFDPDGNVYEVYADVVREWRNQRSGTVTKPKPDWTPGSTPPIVESLYHVDPEIRRVSSAVFHPAYTTHAAMVVKDLAKSEAHYQDLIGLRTLSKGANGDIAVMAGTATDIALVLIQATDARPAGYHHVSMKVEDVADLKESTWKARSMGLPIAVEISESGRFAVQIRDGEGYLTHLYADSARGPDYESLTADKALLLL
ncbi:VOC family protein [Ferrovibrio sp.]|uniref:VOC family protein n=1 Tax=Ferrovibrio sp. TaxID=1917215 RepID=UPI00351557AE